MSIFVGADHRGFELKNRLVGSGVLEAYDDVVDLGADVLEPLDDYNDVAVEAAKRVLEHVDEEMRAILICGSAQGEMMQTNRFKGIRAVNPRNPEETMVCKEYHDANVLCLGNRMVGTLMAENIVDAFLHTDFGGERHQRRVDQITELDETRGE